MIMGNENFPVLLVEDNKHDVMSMKRAFKKHNIANPLFVVPHGQACLDFLRNEGKYDDPDEFPTPGIIIMDIRMPVMDGISCLREIKSDEQLKLIPVIMLTTSKQDEDRVISYDLGCNTFIQKPVDFNKFSEAVAAIHLYWKLSSLP